MVTCFLNTTSIGLELKWWSCFTSIEPSAQLRTNQLMTNGLLSGTHHLFDIKQLNLCLSSDARSWGILHSPHNNVWVKDSFSFFVLPREVVSLHFTLRLPMVCLVLFLVCIVFDDDVNDWKDCLEINVHHINISDSLRSHTTKMIVLINSYNLEQKKKKKVLNNYQSIQ